MGKFIKFEWQAGIGLFAALMLTACVGTVERASGGHIDLNSKEFEDYVAEVFRFQNRVADELAFALVDLDVADSQAPSMEQAEAMLLLACSGLNELATAQRDGLRLSARRKLQLARQVPDCERAAIKANGLSVGGQRR